MPMTIYVKLVKHSQVDMLSLKNKRTHFLLNLGAWGNVFQPAMLSSREEKTSICCCQPASEAVFVSEAAKVWDWFPPVMVFDRIIVVQKRATS